MDTTQGQNQTQEVAAAEPQLQVIDKEAYVLEENVFSQGGKLEGLKYYTLQFRNGTEEESQNSVKCILGDGTIPGKWTAKQLIALVNSAVNSSQRVKAQQIILGEEKEKQPQAIVNRLKTNPILFSVEDAEKWVPGERELTIQGMMLKVAKLTKEGKSVEAFALLQEVQKQMAEQLAADSNEG